MPDAHSQTHQAYTRLLEYVVSGALPPGHRVSEQTLSRELKLGRTPVREAILRLREEGVLQQIPRYGTIVRRIEPDDARELYELREALESYAAQTAADRITPPQLAQLTLVCAEMDRLTARQRKGAPPSMTAATWQKFMALDKTFHLLIIEAAGNRQILDVIKRKRIISDLFRLRFVPSSPRLPEQARQFHHRILDALKKRDAEAARKFMSEHIRKGCEEAMRHYHELEQGPPTPAEDSFEHLPKTIANKLKRLDKPSHRKRSR